MDSDEVLRVKNAVLILAGRVDNLQRIVLVLNLDFFAESVLDGGVVALDEVIVDVAHREGGFAYLEKKDTWLVPLTVQAQVIV